jgi:hypothetical protein
MDYPFQRHMVRKRRRGSATRGVNVNPITAEELTEAIKYSKDKKTPDYDGILSSLSSMRLLHYIADSEICLIYVGGLDISLKTGVLLL